MTKELEAIEKAYHVVDYEFLNKNFYLNNKYNNMLLEKYIKAGVNQNKIIVTKEPSVVNWSLSRKCIVGGDSGIEPLEVINDENGNKKLSFENNIMVSMLIRTELTKEDIEQINNSEGIICTDALYGRDGFRYGFIPS